MRLVLIRHGNTFDKGDVIRRVGCGTDLPLSVSGREQAVMLGQHLGRHGLRPDRVMTSTLRRTQETADLALNAALYHDIPRVISPALNELDYGPDEGKPENDVIARLGADILEKWETESVLPPGWSPSPDQIRQQISTLKDEFASQPATSVQWAVTSNGIARFFLDGCDWAVERPETVKLGTARYALFDYVDGIWVVRGWNLNPGA